MESEIWVSISDFPNYEVSNLGTIRSIPRQVRHRYGGVAVKKGRVQKPQSTPKGYLFVNLCYGELRAQRYVHRLVAQYFLPKPKAQQKEVNHKNMIKSDNRCANLEWVTRRGNQIHASGKRVFDAMFNERRRLKMTPESVQALRRDRMQGQTYREIAATYGISASMVGCIVRNQNWKEQRSQA